MYASNAKQMICVQLLKADNYQCRNKMAAYEVHYLTLKCPTLRTKKHEIKRVTVVATHSYLLTNLVANFHVKFHQNQLKAPDSQTQFEQCGVVTWLVCIFSRQTAESNHRVFIYCSVNSANLSEIFVFRTFAE